MTGPIRWWRGRSGGPATAASSFRRDLAFAVLVALLSVVLVWLPDRTMPPPVQPILLAAQGLALCLRRTHPQLCLALVMLVQAVLTAAMPPGEGLRGAALAVAVYTCGTLLPARRALLLAAAAVLAEIGSYVVVNGLVDPLIVGQLIVAALWYGGASMIGQNVAVRRRYAALVEIRAAEAAVAQRERVAAALAAERSRMARELHDVAAHHLTSLIVQASLVERLLDRDVEAARRSAAAVREEGRKALSDLRFIVGALREADAPEGGAPVPGLDRIAELTGADDVTLTVSGEHGELPAAVDLALYRVAQEAVSNARDHAPGAAIEVTVRHGEHDVTLEVRNGPGAGGAVAVERTHRGFGLIGMRERATLIGAALDAGPAPGGGWLVRLTVPPRRGAVRT